MHSGCGSQQFGDGDMVDITPGHSAFSQQHPSLQKAYFSGQAMPGSPMFSEEPYAELQQEASNGLPEYEPEYEYDDSFESFKGTGGERSQDVRSFLIPFKIQVVPADMTDHHAMWKVKDQFPKPFGRPGNRELSDQCILKGVDLMDVHHDFPDDLAFQVSMRDSKFDEASKNDPEFPEGERIEGQMYLGSYKTMPVHYTLSPNVEKDIPISENRGNYAQSFLESFNEVCESQGQKAWNEEDLKNKGVHKSTRGKLLVERVHPIVEYINAVYPDGQVSIESAGSDHISIGQKAFGSLVKDLVNEAASNIKLKNVREDLRIFVMRPIKADGAMTESTWLAEEGFTDNVASNGTAETIKSRMRNKKYTISGKLGLSYIPLKVH